MLTPEGFTRRSVHAQGDKLRRQIALSVLENFCANFCGCQRILLQQQVVQIQSDLIFCDLLQRQNSVAATKTGNVKHFVHKQYFISVSLFQMLFLYLRCNCESYPVILQSVAKCCCGK